MTDTMEDEWKNKIIFGDSQSMKELGEESKNGRK